MDVFKTFLLFVVVCNSATAILTHQNLTNFNTRSEFQTNRRLKRADTGCAIVINELNTDSPSSTTSQFIEILRKCYQGFQEVDGSSSLDGFKLIIIRGHPPELVFVLDLSSFKMEKVDGLGRIFLLGGTSVATKWKASLTHSSIQSIFDDQRLPIGDDSPYGVALLSASPKTTLRDIKLQRVNNKYVPTDLNRIPNFGNIMRQYTEDLLVYGRRVYTNRCYTFDKILKGPDYAKTPSSAPYEGDFYLLRDFDDPAGQDYSLNRCSNDMTAAVPSRYRLGIPSPGAANDCTGSPFFLEDHLRSLNLLPTSPDDVVPMEGCEPDAPGVSPNDYRDLSSEQYHTLVQQQLSREKNGCPSDATGLTGTAMDVVETTSNARAIQAYGHQVTWATAKIHQFDPRWQDICRNDFPSSGLTLKNPEIQAWLDIKQEGDHCRYSCHACKTYFDMGFRADVKKRTLITTEEGYFNKEKSQNREMVEKHMESDLHKDATKFLSLVIKASSESELQVVIDAERNKESDDLQETMNLITLVYAETLSDVSFAKHPILWTATKTMGARLGYHHWTDTAAASVVEVLAEEMHANLLKYLVKENQPFAFIVDTSTDDSNQQYLITYIQGIEDDFPMVWLYSLIHLPNGETAQQMYDALIWQLEVDDVRVPGFKSYVRSKLKVFASDGANSMKGPRNSLSSKLKAFVGGHLPVIWCMGHRTDLAIKQALLKNADPEFKVFQRFEGFSNNFYKFYLSRGSKRWNHLKEIASQLDLNVVRIKYYFNLRWSSSHYSAISAIERDYEALMIDLTAIAISEDQFTRSAREDAQALHALLEDKTNAFLVHEYVDFLTVYKQLSEAFQGTQGLLVGKAGAVQAAIDSLQKLKVTPGKKVETFLASCSCPVDTVTTSTTAATTSSTTAATTSSTTAATTTSTTAVPAQRVPCTVESYFQSRFPVCKGKTFISNANSGDFSRLRPKMYNSLVNGLKEYFDLEKLNTFESFNPVSLQPSETQPTTSNRIPNAACDVTPPHQTHWTKLCQFYFKQGSGDLTRCTAAVDDWKKLIDGITKSEIMMDNRKENVASFWSMALSNSGLPWTPVLQEVVTLMMVTPFSSADCERGFSIMNKLKGDYRSSMTPKRLGQLLRVRINGPKNIKMLKVEQYAKAFLKNHIKPSDKPNFHGRPKNPSSEKTFGKSSRLF